MPDTEERGLVVVDETTKREIDDFSSWAMSIEVHNAEEKAAVLDVIREAKRQRRAIDEIFDASIKSAFDLHRGLLAKKKSFTDILDEAEKKGKAAIIRFDTEQERERRAEEARLQAEADAKAQKERETLEKKALKLKTPELREARLAEAAQTMAPLIVLDAPEKSAGVSTRKTWKARVINAALVPRDFLIVDDRKLQEFARTTSGRAPVRGVEFYEEASLAIKG